MSTETLKWRLPTRWEASLSQRRAVICWTALFQALDSIHLVMLSIVQQAARLGLRSELVLCLWPISWVLDLDSTRTRTTSLRTICRSLGSELRRNSSRIDKRKEIWKHRLDLELMSQDYWSAEKGRNTQWEITSQPSQCPWIQCQAQEHTSLVSSQWPHNTGSMAVILELELLNVQTLKQCDTLRILPRMHTHLVTLRRDQLLIGGKL